MENDNYNFYDYYDDYYDEDHDANYGGGSMASDYLAEGYFYKLLGDIDM